MFFINTAKLIGENIVELDEFEDEVKLWVYQEMISGRNLTDIINEDHENVGVSKNYKNCT